MINKVCFMILRRPIVPVNIDYLVMKIYTSSRKPRYFRHSLMWIQAAMKVVSTKAKMKTAT